MSDDSGKVVTRATHRAVNLIVSFSEKGSVVNTLLVFFASILLPRIAPEVLLPWRGASEALRDTLCQKSGYRGRNG